jgi:hypothetical protein
MAEPSSEKEHPACDPHLSGLLASYGESAQVLGDRIKARLSAYSGRTGDTDG